MKPSNPYNYNLPVGPEMFYGRQTDLEILVNVTCSAPGDSCALIGGRRMGKTSLLEAMYREMVKETETRRSIIIPVFIDLSGTGITSASEFFCFVGQMACEQLENQWNVSAETLQLGDKQPPAPLFERLLPKWERRVIDKLGRGLRLVILLDECEQIAEQPWSTELYTALRHLLVSQQTRSLLKVVMAGAHRFLTRVRQEGSPLRNILKYHILHGLDSDATHRLIVEPTRTQIDELVIQAVINQAGGHPFLTQYLMYNLFEIGLKKVTSEFAIRQAKQFSRERNDFQDWLDGLGKPGYQIYQLFTQSKKPLAEREIQSALNPYPANFLQSLEALRYHGLINLDDNDKYAIAPQMFRDWFISFAVNSSNETVEPAINNLSLNQAPIQQVYVDGDYVVGDKPIGLDQRKQTIKGKQENLSNIALPTKNESQMDEALAPFKNLSTTYPEIKAMSDLENAIFVSYAWGGDSENTVDELEKAFATRDIRIVRDKKDLGYKGSIEAFEQRIGRGQCIVLVISDKYLRSEHCMYELVEVDENRDLRERIFPIVLGDAHIFKAIDRLTYIQHWDEQIAQLNQAIKQVGVVSNLSGILADLDKYTRIRANIDHLTDLLSDMNTLTPEIHASSGFSTLINAVQQAMEGGHPPLNAPTMPEQTKTPVSASNERYIAFDQRGQTIQGSQTNIAGNVNGPVFSGAFQGPVTNDQCEIHTGGGDHVEGDKNQGNITVGNITGSTGVAIGNGASATVTQSTGEKPENIAAAFRILSQKVEKMADGDDKDEARNAVTKLHEEAAKGDAAEESRIRRWFNFLADTAPDAFEVAVETFGNPIKGLSLAFQKIAKKARDER